MASDDPRTPDLHVTFCSRDELDDIAELSMKGTKNALGDEHCNE